MEEIRAKKWFIKSCIVLFSVLFLIALLVIIVDPYFHYHKPFSFLPIGFTLRGTVCKRWNFQKF